MIDHRLPPLALGGRDVVGERADDLYLVAAVAKGGNDQADGQRREAGEVVEVDEQDPASRNRPDGDRRCRCGDGLACIPRGSSRSSVLGHSAASQSKIMVSQAVRIAGPMSAADHNKSIDASEKVAEDIKTSRYEDSCRLVSRRSYPGITLIVRPNAHHRMTIVTAIGGDS
ncbi:hypothetical protein [Methylobacterium oryzihabitans]|uniref:Uncharacterized protein n=1 Tax=Methylobacterium oryzihabitans TaxID=2499852 RepID=A0A437P4M5_9HYPH|nr:hypothetical protein [Methylobacterium oryzihabitans]RVU17184.1 hypothetical protein EOE48_14870 [Methylobacterium oryzihabitans]